MKVPKQRVKNRNTKKDYINNEKLLDEVVLYLERLKLAKAKGTKLPQMTKYMGECFIKIAENFSNNYSFRNYPMRDEMVADGVLFCVKAIEAFDPNRTTNVFAFLTQSVYFAFLQRIDKEKRYLYTKYKITLDSDMLNRLSEHQAGDDVLEESIYTAESTSSMSDFIKAYDETLRKRKEKIT